MFLPSSLSGYPYTSPIGTPVYNDLEIKGDSYTINGQNYSFTDVKIPEAIITVAERENNLVVTEITGSPSPIVEYIGSKARIIDITMKITNNQAESLQPKLLAGGISVGGIIGAGSAALTGSGGSYGTYPLTEVQNILTMLRSNQVLQVVSSYFNQILGVYNIVIISENPPQSEGNLNIQTINFKCMEIQPFQLFGNTGNSAGNSTEQQNQANTTA